MKRYVWGPYSAIGLWVAFCVFLLDQLSKYWIVQIFWPAKGCDPFNEPRLFACQFEVLPFMDFTMVWNRGISYGLLAQDGDFGRWVLIVFSVLAALGFCFWLVRAEGRLMALAIGLIVGGAVGNALDRVVYGAVADFVSLHGFGFYWYIFNVADVAIVAGAAGLLYDLLILSPVSKGKIP